MSRATKPIAEFEHLACLTPDERARWRRWQAQVIARVTHPGKGMVIVPCMSKYAAIENAAELWGCRLSDLLWTAGVWAAKPGDKPAKMPKQPQKGGMQYAAQ